MKDWIYVIVPFAALVIFIVVWVGSMWARYDNCVQAGDGQVYCLALGAGCYDREVSNSGRRSK